LHFATWEGAGDQIVTSNHHDREDFTRVKDLGMNVVRFALNYRAFEDDATRFVFN
jgi:aryl-phospho-beta-D-glucosidase BglC (GH1 family)